MADDFEEQEWVKFGVAASLSKQYAADQRSFLESLAIFLEGTMGGVRVTIRVGGAAAASACWCVTMAQCGPSVKTEMTNSVSDPRTPAPRISETRESCRRPGPSPTG